MKSTRSYLVLFFALTTVGTLALAYRQYLAIVTLRAQLADPTSGAQKQLADANRLIKQLRGELGRADTPPAPVAAQPEAPGGPARNRRNPGPGMAGNIQKLMNDPAFQKLVAVQQKTQLDGRYAALFKALNLSPAQLDQLKNLLVQKQQAQADALQAARDQGINFRDDPQALRQAINDAQSSADDQIKAALGDSGYAQYQEYNQTATERTLVNQVQQSLSYTAAPLTDEQSRQLVQILAENEETGPNAQAGGGPPDPITDKILSQAAAVLSAPQLQALQQVQAEQQAQRQMRQMIQSAQGRPSGPPDGG